MSPGIWCGSYIRSGCCQLRRYSSKIIQTTTLGFIWQTHCQSRWDGCVKAVYQMFLKQCLMLATRWRRAPAFIKAHWGAVTLNWAFELEFRKRLKNNNNYIRFHTKITSASIWSIDPSVLIVTVSFHCIGPLLLRCAVEVLESLPRVCGQRQVHILDEWPVYRRATEQDKQHTPTTNSARRAVSPQTSSQSSDEVSVLSLTCTILYRGPYCRECKPLLP